MDKRKARNIRRQSFDENVSPAKVKKSLFFLLTLVIKLICFAYLSCVLWFAIRGYYYDEKIKISQFVKEEQALGNDEISIKKMKWVIKAKELGINIDGNAARLCLEFYDVAGYSNELQKLKKTIGKKLFQRIEHECDLWDDPSYVSKKTSTKDIDKYEDEHDNTRKMNDNELKEENSKTKMAARNKKGNFIDFELIEVLKVIEALNKKKKRQIHKYGKWLKKRLAAPKGLKVNLKKKRNWYQSKRKLDDLTQKKPACTTMQPVHRNRVGENLDSTLLEALLPEQDLKIVEPAGSQIEKNQDEDDNLKTQEQAEVQKIKSGNLMETKAAIKNLSPVTVELFRTIDFVINNTVETPNLMTLMDVESDEKAGNENFVEDDLNLDDLMNDGAEVAEDPTENVFRAYIETMEFKFLVGDIDDIDFEIPPQDIRIYDLTTEGEELFLIAISTRNINDLGETLQKITFIQDLDENVTYMMVEDRDIGKFEYVDVEVPPNNDEFIDFPPIEDLSSESFS